MRHYQEQYIMYDDKTGQIMDGYNWVADPVSANSGDDVLESAIAGLMHDRDLTEENSTVEYQPVVNPHRRVADVYYWNGTMSRAVKEQIIVDEVIIWDDLDLNELSPVARSIIEESDQSINEFLYGCNTIEEIEHTLILTGITRCAEK